jgi:hypothetical protein
VTFPGQSSALALRALVDALLRENGNRIRIIQEESDGGVGNFGGAQRWTYGTVIRWFCGLLQKLVETGACAAIKIACNVREILACWVSRN